MITQENIPYTADEIKAMVKTCEKYNSALSRAAFYNGELPTENQRKMLLDIFPELVADNDEKIRKEIVDFITASNKYGTNERCEAWLNWLEKQGKRDTRYKCLEELLEADTEYQIAMNDAMVEEAKTKAIEAISDMPIFELLGLEKQGEPKDKGEISDGYHTFNELYQYRMLYNAAFFNMLPKEIVHKSKRHHDGEECFGGGWFVVMANLPTGQISNHYELKDWDLFQIPEKDVADEWDGHTPQEAADRLHRYLLERQREQPTNKIEPKFKVRDWIANGGANPCYVKSIFGDYYELCSCEGFEYTKHIIDVNYTYHLWAINDAKDGDVLVGKDGRPFIFTGEFDVQDDNPTAYCGINSNDKFITGKGFHWTFKDGIKPATKEQRDLLFQKIKEVGYEWDPEKKGLKKMEVVSKESDDERIRKGIIRNLQYLMDRSEGFVKDELNERIVWLEKQGENQRKLNYDC